MKGKFWSLLIFAIAVGLVWILVSSSTSNTGSAVGNWGIDPDNNNRSFVALYPGGLDPEASVLELNSNGEGFYLGDIDWKESSGSVEISSEITSLRRTLAQNSIGKLESQRWVLELRKVGSQRLELITTEGKKFMVFRKIVP